MHFALGPVGYAAIPALGDLGPARICFGRLQGPLGYLWTGDRIGNDLVSQGPLQLPVPVPVISRGGRKVMAWLGLETDRVSLPPLAADRADV